MSMGGFENFKKQGVGKGICGQGLPSNKCDQCRPKGSRMAQTRGRTGKAGAQTTKGEAANLAKHVVVDTSLGHRCGPSRLYREPMLWKAKRRKDKQRQGERPKQGGHLRQAKTSRQAQTGRRTQKDHKPKQGDAPKKPKR